MSCVKHGSPVYYSSGTKPYTVWVKCNVCLCKWEIDEWKLNAFNSILCPRCGVGNNFGDKISNER